MKIQADLRPLIEGQEQSLLTSASVAAATTLNVDSATNFAANDFVIVGVLGTETAEIRKIASIAANVLTLFAALTYAHSQDTSVVYTPYDKMNFFYSTTATSTLSALNGSPQAIAVDNIYNMYSDTANSTGYGWYRFYNSVTAVTSDLSNGVPYAGFGIDTVKYIFDQFLVQIQNKEKKLIKEEEMYAWLNEAYTIARNRLSLGNREYTVQAPYTISVVAGTAEYAVPTGFMNIRMLTNSTGGMVSSIPFEEAAMYSAADTEDSASPRYYKRGTYIGFTPTPTEDTTYSLVYTKLGSTLSSYTDTIDLPNNNVFFLVDYMKFRATPIIGGDDAKRLEAFIRGLNELIVTSHKQGGGLDSIGIAESSTV